MQSLEALLFYGYNMLVDGRKIYGEQMLFKNEKQVNKHRIALNKDGDMRSVQADVTKMLFR